MFIVYFLLWTFCLYWLHRFVHFVPTLRNIHLDHHSYINTHKTGWHWNNLFLFNDTWVSTFDLWITEVIPTVIFSYITCQWWLCVLYYVWAALLQENLEHNEDFNITILTSGKWHLKHHKNVNCNYGLFIPLWDKIFKTER